LLDAPLAPPASTSFGWTGRAGQVRVILDLDSTFSAASPVVTAAGDRVRQIAEPKRCLQANPWTVALVD
jgi:hypothetical protein